MLSTPQPLVSKSPAQRSTGISILLVVTLFLQSHAGLAYGDVVRDDPYDLFDATEYTNRTVAVRWETTDNVLARCNEEAMKRGFATGQQQIQACAQWDGGSCLIVTNEQASMHTVGHEIRHCFQGAWH